MKQTDLMRAQGITERDLIESIINSYFFIDYGTITKVNSDKTVNVQHAKIPVLENGKKLKALQSNNIELLTLSGENFSFNAGTKEGDKVLLLGLKDYIEKVSDVSGAGEQSAYVHYKRDSLKAFPLCTFNGEAKVTVTVEDDSLKIKVAKKIELNGNSKNFVTWKELNDALQTLWAAIQTHTHTVSTTGTGVATAGGVTIGEVTTQSTGTAAASTELSTQSLDISKAKTENIVTG